MSILSDFEDRIGRALEGGFANMFRAPVQPAELARKLGREMDRGKKLGVGKVYAPILYTVLLSRQDDAALGGFADTLAGELETYLLSYAREHNYELATRPVVRFLVDRELKLGRFEVIGELISPEEMAAELGYTPDEEQFETPRMPSNAGGGAPLAGAPLAAPPVACLRSHSRADTRSRRWHLRCRRTRAGFRPSGTAKHRGGSRARRGKSSRADHPRGFPCNRDRARCRSRRRAQRRPIGRRQAFYLRHLPVRRQRLA